MPTVTFSLFPGGKRKALTMSYDDGTVHDRRLVEIFNRHGIRGTFHLNSSWLHLPAHVSAEELPRRRLRCSVDCTMIYNPSAIPVWVSIDNKPQRIAPGETLRADG